MPPQTPLPPYPTMPAQTRRGCQANEDAGTVRPARIRSPQKPQQYPPHLPRPRFHPTSGIACRSVASLRAPLEQMRSHAVKRLSDARSIEHATVDVMTILQHDGRLKCGNCGRDVHPGDSDDDGRKEHTLRGVCFGVNMRDAWVRHLTAASVSRCQLHLHAISRVETHGT